MTQENVTSKKKTFICMWLIFAFALFVRYYNHKVDAYDSTMYAFWYKYGFISRGFIGTIFHFVDKIVPFDMISYPGTILFTIGVTGLFFLLIFLFFIFSLKSVPDSHISQMEYLIMFYTIITIPMFSCEYNFGRLDLYLVAISIIAAVLFVKEKSEWLFIPLSMLGIMVHQGYAFMLYNIILVFLMYQILSKSKEERKKYICILVISLFACVMLFFWFEKFSHGNGEMYYEEIVEEAKNLSFEQDYHEDVIDKEILGIDLSSREGMYDKIAFTSLVSTLILGFPLVLFLMRFIKGFVQRTAKEDRFKYYLVAAGPLTLIPMYLMKCDYGRWTYALLAYYCIMFISLMVKKDAYVLAYIKDFASNIKGKKIWATFLLAYLLLFQPILDISVNEWTDRLSAVLNDTIMHWW